MSSSHIILRIACLRNMHTYRVNFYNHQVVKPMYRIVFALKCNMCKGNSGDYDVPNTFHYFMTRKFYQVTIPGNKG